MVGRLLEAGETVVAEIGIVGAAGLLVIALLVGVMVHQVREGTLPRNGLFGIRTAQTKASDEAWEVGHRAALPLLRVTVVVALVAAAVVLALTVWLSHRSSGPAEAATAVQVLFGLVVLVVVAAAVKANRAAREVNDR